MEKIRRNNPSPCESGKNINYVVLIKCLANKYKYCI